MSEHKHAQTIRRYFAACNEADYDKLVSCFAPDAVHYFPDGLPDIPWRSADTIARKWQWCVEHLGSQWTIEKILVSHDSDEAVIEWTHWKGKLGTALRGDEWYIFDKDSGLIQEIRAYYAAPADKQVSINQLVDFDYSGRGYHLEPLQEES
ncbi:nuclear transport factor 2 family protein [Pseudomonas monteilii]|uniref:nuclear transport factor 2 family protein n=1 Tax=Pseudomonas monteilii TaxID=76759 RepID=UPI0037FA007F